MTPLTSRLLAVLLGILLLAAGCAPSQPDPRPKPAAGSDRMDAATRRAFEVYAQNLFSDDPSQAVELFRKRAEQSPSHPLPRALLASLLERAGRFDEAAREAELALFLAGGRHPVAEEVLGRVALDRGQPEEALRRFRRQAETAPEGSPMHATAVARAAYVVLWTEGPERARADFGGAGAAAGASPWAASLAMALDLLGDRSGEAAGKARSLASGSALPGPVSAVLAASALAEAGEPEEALAVLDRAVEERPGSRPLQVMRAHLAARVPDRAREVGVRSFLAVGPLPGHRALLEGVVRPAGPLPPRR